MFFTVVVGLSLGEVGIGLTIAAIASFLVAVPMGKLVDHFGPKRMWSLSAVMQGALFFAWPFIDSFPEYVALAVVHGGRRDPGRDGPRRVHIDVLPPSERVESRAYMYSALNVGFSLGAFVGAGPSPSAPTCCAGAVLTARCFLVNAAAITPAARRHARSPRQRAPREGEGPRPRSATAAGWRSPPYRCAVDQPGDPQHRHPAVAGRPRPTPRGAGRGAVRHQHGHVHLPAPAGGARRQGRRTALRAMRVSALFFVLSCVITLSTHETVGWVTIALFFLGHVVLTGAELFLSAAGWTLEAELMDPRRRGEYQGAAELGGTLGRVWAPAVYVPRDELGRLGWLVIAGIVVAAAAAPRRRPRRSTVPRAQRPGRRAGRRAAGDPTLGDAPRAARPRWREPGRSLTQSPGDHPR